MTIFKETKQPQQHHDDSIDENDGKRRLTCHRSLSSMDDDNDENDQHSSDFTYRKKKLLTEITIDGNYYWPYKRADDDLQADKEVTLAAVTRYGHALKYASDTLKADYDIVHAAVNQNGGSLSYASDSLKGNKEIVLAAVTKDGVTLEYARDDLKEDKDIVLIAVSCCGKALEYVSETLKGDKDVVLMAVRQNGWALPYATDQLRADKDVIMTAISTTDGGGVLLKYASEDLKADKEVVMTAVIQSNGWALEHAHVSQRADKDIVLAAVSLNSEMLKFALGGLNQDHDCWVASGLWRTRNRNRMNPHPNGGDGGGCDNQTTNRISGTLGSNSTVTTTIIRRVVLSTKFSLNENSESTSTLFTLLLNENSYFQEDDKFYIYSPNAYCKNTCDPEWTRIEWPCRGTIETCRMITSTNNNPLSFDEIGTSDVRQMTTLPGSCCCWRYSFRCQLEEAKQRNGFMIQIVDLERSSQEKDDDEEENDDWFLHHKSNHDLVILQHALGKGQEIETLMAKEVGTKVFRVYQPVWLNAQDKPCSGRYFDGSHINILVSHIQQWYDTNCDDMEECDIRFEERL